MNGFYICISFPPTSENYYMYTTVNELNGQFNFKLSGGPVMAKNCKTPGGLPQTLLGGFTVSPAALRDFQFVKIINALNGLCPSKV